MTNEFNLSSWRIQDVFFSSSFICLLHDFVHCVWVITKYRHWFIVRFVLLNDKHNKPNLTSRMKQHCFKTLESNEKLIPTPPLLGAVIVPNWSLILKVQLKTLHGKENLFSPRLVFTMTDSTFTTFGVQLSTWLSQLHDG